jgi:hypothetical protein
MPHTITISIPVEIITKKISNTKTDSIFYAGKNIAVVHTKTHGYVLTTAGEYSFTNKIQGEEIYNEKSKVVKRLTDKRIKWLNDNNLIGNWGWFGINVWKKVPGKKDKCLDYQCLDYPTDVYSQYDEALKAFVKFVTTEIRKEV